MELSHVAKQRLLANLAQRQHRPYDPEHDITIDDMMAQLAALNNGAGSRNTATRLLKEAVAKGELTEEWALRDCKKIKVFCRPSTADPSTPPAPSESVT